MYNLEVVIPAYNEEGNIARIVGGVRKALGGNCRVLVVDDASEDKTAQLAKEQGAEVIQHPYRMGNGACIKSGLRIARADTVLFMDADGQHRPEDIPLLLKDIDRFDMVIGARGFSGFSWRNIANRIYNLFASYVSQFKIEDLTSGFRAVKRTSASKFMYLIPNGFSYPTTLTLAFLKTGRTIKYVSVSSNPRDEGNSKIRLFSDGARFFLIIARIATFFSPLRVFLPVSFFFLLSGFAYYLYTYLTQHRFTNMAVFLLSNAVLIFMLGLISEQISQLRLIHSDEPE